MSNVQPIIRVPVHNNLNQKKCPLSGTSLDHVRDNGILVTSSTLFIRAKRIEPLYGELYECPLCHEVLVIVNVALIPVR